MRRMVSALQGSFAIVSWVQFWDSFWALTVWDSLSPSHSLPGPRFLDTHPSQTRNHAQRIRRAERSFCWLFWIKTPFPATPPFLTTNLGLSLISATSCKQAGPNLPDHSVIGKSKHNHQTKKKKSPRQLHLGLLLAFSFSGRSHDGGD